MRITNKTFYERAIKIHGLKYKYLFLNIKNAKSYITIICPFHKEFDQTAAAHLSGRGCPGCKSNTRKISLEAFKNSCNKIHNFEYDYSETVFNTVRDHIKIYCHRHGYFYPIAEQHMHGSKCRQCVNDEKSFINKSVDWKNNRSFLNMNEKFIKMSQEKYPNNFIFHYNEIKDLSDEIDIECIKHGMLKIIPKYFLKFGCNLCKKEKSQLREFTKWYIASNIKHNYKFNYSKSIWKGANNKITITCPTHGDFEQWASGHLKYGCEKCANFAKSLPYDEFLQKANLKHLNKYIYDENNYNSIKKKTEKLKIHCPDHGDFYQDIAGHLYVGNGCMSCWKGHVSKMEGEWLDYLQVPIKNRNKSLRINGKLLYPDGFLKETNTVYEFHGDRWHGNPLYYFYMDKNPVSKKTYGVLYANTMEREKLIRDAGYNLIVIWENEWKELRKQTYFI